MKSTRSVVAAALMLSATLAVAVPTASGAICCLPSGQCVDVPAGVCAQISGLFMGNGDCNAFVCIPFGACCMTDLSCDLIPEADCIAAGGRFQGLGGHCDVPCPVVGACCLSDGSCDVFTLAECTAAGGRSMGFGSSCVAAVCTGACCLGLDGNCVDGQTKNECTAQGGVFLGEGEPCAAFTCPAEVQCLSFSFDQNNENPGVADVVLPYQRFSTMGGTRALERVLVTGETRFIALLKLINVGGAALDTDLAQVESVVMEVPAVTRADPTIDPFIDFAFMDILACAVNPLPPGESCDYGGVQTVLDDRVTDLDAAVFDLSNFIGGGVNDVVVTGSGQFNFLGQLFQLLNLVHKVEGEFKIWYEYSVLGACCLPGNDCVVLAEDECVALGGDYQGDLVQCSNATCQEREHPGWNWVDNGITLTANEPAYWSSLTGQPKGVSPFPALDPGGPLDSGRPALDGSTDRVLRGYFLAWAVNSEGEEIRWDHLSGSGAVVDYRDGTSWEYNAYAYEVVDPLVAQGEQTGTPGDLHLDGVEYAQSFAELLLDFQAAGSSGFSAPPADGFMVETNTALTLHAVSVDVRGNNEGPVTTNADVVIWNENESKFSGTHRCITCWDQTLLSRYDTPNNFLFGFLQTDHGKARIAGVADDACDIPDDPGIPGDDSVTSIDAPLLGVAGRLLAINGGVPAGTNAASGGSLFGLGFDPTGLIRYDVTGEPPEGREASAPAGPLADRVSGTEKGSLLYFPRIELRWDENGVLVRDTFISMSNDFAADVRVKIYFINGDPPLAAGQ